jgi:hypothetical protein
MCDDDPDDPSRQRPMPTIVSGGQTGVDRAALDVALELGLPCGGWCPKGRRAEDGPIPERYPLRETESEDYDERTVRNVLESDATLILTRGRPAGGTAFTIEAATAHRRPLLIVDLAAGDRTPADAAAWAASRIVRALNVAGPREPGAPGVYQEARAFLRDMFRGWMSATSG